MKQCPNKNCATMYVEPSANYCSSCGIKLTVSKCKKCNCEISKLDKFCSNCGEKTEECIYNDKNLFDMRESPMNQEALKYKNDMQKFKM